MRVREALHGTAKVVATVVIAAAVGLGAGRGIAEVAGGSASAGLPADPATDTAAQPQPPADDDAPRDAEPAVGVMVTFAGLRPAGRARDRARLRVGLRVRNRSDRSVDPPRIQVGEDTIRVDLDAAEDLAGNVLEPLSPGSSAKGELRFETAGETTLELMEGRSTTLRIAGRKIEVRYEVGPRLSQPSEEPSSGSTTTTVPSPQSG
jgi:hypothetical protein